jgi:hypothetical protein
VCPPPPNLISYNIAIERGGEGVNVNDWTTTPTAFTQNYLDYLQKPTGEVTSRERITKYLNISFRTRLTLLYFTDPGYALKDISEK